MNLCYKFRNVNKPLGLFVGDEAVEANILEYAVLVTDMGIQVLYDLSIDLRKFDAVLLKRHPILIAAVIPKDLFRKTDDCIMGFTQNTSVKKINWDKREFDSRIYATSSFNKQQWCECDELTYNPKTQRCDMVFSTSAAISRKIFCADLRSGDTHEEIIRQVKEILSDDAQEVCPNDCHQCDN